MHCLRLAAMPWVSMLATAHGGKKWCQARCAALSQHADAWNAIRDAVRDAIRYAAQGTPPLGAHAQQWRLCPAAPCMEHHRAYRNTGSTSCMIALMLGNVSLVNLYLAAHRSICKPDMRHSREQHMSAFIRSHRMTRREHRYGVQHLLLCLMSRVLHHPCEPS
jgi:hypothetical protein